MPVFPNVDKIGISFRLGFSCAAKISYCEFGHTAASFLCNVPMQTLIIDDSCAMRRILGEIMSELGFEITEAEHGRDGLERLLARPDAYEVVLVDWNMPEMNGVEFVVAVRERSELATQKIVMVTTEAEPGRVATALMAGVDEFVMKPFTKELLIDKLQLIGVSTDFATEV